jgi:peptide/nickel transport system ATP-binding protein
VHFETEDGLVQGRRRHLLHRRPGQTLGIVGESGSGKSVSSLTVMGLTRARNARITGTGALRRPGPARRVRGGDAAIRGDDDRDDLPGPAVLAAPLLQGRDADRRGRPRAPDVSKAQAWDRAVEMLSLVGIPEPRKRADAYPHEFSAACASAR